MMREAREWFQGWSAPEARAGEAMLAEDAPHVGPVVQLGAEHAPHTSPAAVPLRRDEHAEGRSREVDPPAGPGPPHQRRCERAGRIHAHPRNRAFDSDIDGHEQSRAYAGP